MIEKIDYNSITAPSVDSYITTISNNIQYQIEDNLLEQIVRKLSNRMHPTFQYKCNSCGGTVELDIDNHIFRCPYCGTVYAIGTNQINDVM